MEPSDTPIEDVEVSEADVPNEGALTEGNVANEQDGDASEEVVDLTEAAVAPSPADSPTVDALEEQLGRLQGAMDKLQSGDLDGAERSIEALEQQMSNLRN